jgi:hypothetical protein
MSSPDEKYANLYETHANLYKKYAKKQQVMVYIYDLTSKYLHTYKTGIEDTKALDENGKLEFIEFLKGFLTYLSNNHKEVLEELINFRDFNDSIFHEGVKTGDLETVEALLSKFGVNEENQKGDTPLYMSIGTDVEFVDLETKKKMVKLLLDNGAKATVKSRDFYPIELACQKGYTEIVKLLRGPSANLKIRYDLNSCGSKMSRIGSRFIGNIRGQHTVVAPPGDLSHSSPAEPAGGSRRRRRTKKSKKKLRKSSRTHSSKKQTITRRMKGGVPCTGLNWADANSYVLKNVVMEDGRNIERVTKWLDDRKECSNYGTIISNFTNYGFTKAVKYIYNGEGGYYTALVALLISELKRLGLNQERVNFYNKRKEFESGKTVIKSIREDSIYGWKDSDEKALAEINKNEEEFKGLYNSGNMGAIYDDRDSSIGLNPSLPKNL